jgi:hypothetical protein
MKGLNGLTRPWDAFIQSICAKKEKLKFDYLWEECIQEESRVANQEDLFSIDEDKNLDTHTKGGRKNSYFLNEDHKEFHTQNKFIHKESQPKRFQKKGQTKERDFSSYEFYHCDKMGHIARHCPTI